MNVVSKQDFKISNIEVELIDIVAPLFDAYRQFYKQESNIPAARHFLFERLVNKESIVYAAFAGQTPVGFMQLYPTFSSISLEPTWILNDLYVVPEYRKQGVATQLIETAKTLVKVREDKGLTLSTAEDNKQAQRVYEAVGFVNDTEFRRYNWSRQ
jgi:GNAT superfamily N-acetyltransferase